MLTVKASRASRVIGPVAVLTLLVALAGCGSSTVSRRISFVETNGRPRFDAGAITVTKGDTLKLTVGNRTANDRIRSGQNKKMDATNEQEPPEAAEILSYEFAMGANSSPQRFVVKGERNLH